MATAGQDAIGALYERIGPLAFRLARAILADAAEAEDVVQEAFLRIWRRHEQLLGPDELDGYTVRTVRNLAYKRIRRREVEGRAQESLEHAAVLVAGPAASREPPALDAALRKLPPEQREVIQLRVYEGLPMNTIADQTGVPLGTVHSRYRYALSKLRDHLREGHHDR